IDIRSARVQEVTIEHVDGETVRITKENPEQTNFDVEGIPEGRELLYAGVANVMGNSLRELQLEDVESASNPATEEKPGQTTFRTFDGLVVTVSGIERDEAPWIELHAAAAASTTDGENAPSDAPQDDADTSEDGSESAADPAAEAAAINARVEGWRYRIPS